MKFETKERKSGSLGVDSWWIHFSVRSITRGFVKPFEGLLELLLWMLIALDNGTRQSIEKSQLEEATAMGSND